MDYAEYGLAIDDCCDVYHVSVDLEDRRHESRGIQRLWNIFEDLGPLRNSIRDVIVPNDVCMIVRLTKSSKIKN